MTNLRVTLGSLAIVAALFTSCGDNNDAVVDDAVIVPPPPPTRAIPTSQEFAAIKTLALENQTQDFEIDLEESLSFTTAKGVQITLPSGTCITKNGEPVTGTVLVEVVELFEKGQMLTTNKTTMGRMENGDKGLLISGGEFYINATQDGVTLVADCGFSVTIPADLTGGVDNDMTLWEGVADCDGLDDDCDDITWEQDAPREGTQNGFGEGDAYYPFFNGFGWTNVDRFYSDPRDKTTILVDVPEGYDNTNSSVYLSYDGEANALANLDTYDATTELFSEHYGLIPIGLECHVIFVSEADGAWLYAIKAATIVANGTIVIAEADLGTATEAELITLINDLP